MSRILALLAGDPQADRAVPPTGYTVWLTVFASGAMAFLAVFALALSLAAGRLADRWGAELARASTLRISAPSEQMAEQVEAALAVLRTTPGVAEARALSGQEQRALLEPWFGPELPMDLLALPALIEIVETEDGFDSIGLRARLAGEVPGAVLDDHGRWRAPLVEAASRLRWMGAGALILIAGSMTAMITLAAQAALAANGQVITVLRLIGARDVYIARAFVRRFTLRAVAGAGLGTVVGTGLVALLPRTEVAGGFLTGLGFQGAGWLWPAVIPLLAAVTAFVATRRAALRTLERQA